MQNENVFLDDAALPPNGAEIVNQTGNQRNLDFQIAAPQSKYVGDTVPISITKDPLWTP